MVISRSRTVEPLFPDFVIGGSVVEMVSELKIWVSFSIPSWSFKSKSEQLLSLPRWGLALDNPHRVSRLIGGSVSCTLLHRRKVASLSVFFKIDSLVDHPVRGLFPAQYIYMLRRPTRGALAAHSRSFEMPKFRTVQFLRSFVLSCVLLWNGLHESVFAGEGISVLLKLQSIAFFYFFLFFRLFLFHFSFSRDLR